MTGLDGIATTSVLVTYPTLLEISENHLTGLDGIATSLPSSQSVGRFFSENHLTGLDGIATLTASTATVLTATV